MSIIISPEQAYYAKFAKTQEGAASIRTGSSTLTGHGTQKRNRVNETTFSKPVQIAHEDRPCFIPEAERETRRAFLQRQLDELNSMYDEENNVQEDKTNDDKEQEVIMKRISR